MLCSMASSSSESCMLMLQGGLPKCTASLLGALSSDALRMHVAILIQHIAQRLPQAQVCCSPGSAHGHISAAPAVLRHSLVSNLKCTWHHCFQPYLKTLVCPLSIHLIVQGRLVQDARPAICLHLGSTHAVAMACAVQAAFQDAAAVPALQQLLQLGPDHPTAGTAAKALLVLLYDFHRAPAWL